MEDRARTSSVAGDSPPGAAGPQHLYCRESPPDQGSADLVEAAASAGIGLVNVHPLPLPGVGRRTASASSGSSLGASWRGSSKENQAARTSSSVQFRDTYLTNRDSSLTAHSAHVATSFEELGEEICRLRSYVGEQFGALKIELAAGRRFGFKRGTTGGSSASSEGFQSVPSETRRLLPSSSFEVASALAASARCPNGHALHPVAGAGGNCQAQACERAVPKMRTVLQCSQCKWWMCKECATGRDSISSEQIIRDRTLRFRNGSMNSTGESANGERRGRNPQLGSRSRGSRDSRDSTDTYWRRYSTEDEDERETVGTLPVSPERSMDLKKKKCLEPQLSNISEGGEQQQQSQSILKQGASGASLNKQVTIVENSRELAGYASEARMAGTRPELRRSMTARVIDRLSEQAHFFAATAMSMQHKVSRRGSIHQLEVETGNFATQIVMHPGFDMVIFLSIVANSIVIGMQIHLMTLLDVSAALVLATDYVQHVFAAVFFLELLLRLVAEGPKRFFCSGLNWNWFDLGVVALSLGDLGIELISLVGGDFSATVDNIMLLRILRVMRLTRLLRIVRVAQFAMSLRWLVYSITVTMRMLVWALILLGLMIYVFAAFFTAIALHQIQTTHDVVVDVELKRFWGTLADSAMTLSQSISGGLDWRDASMPLRHVHWVYELVFFAYIVMSFLAVLNVVTGVFCSNAMAAADRDPEMIAIKKEYDEKLATRILQQLFMHIDEDKSGKVTLSELEISLDDPNCRSLFNVLGIETDDAWLLFKCLDADGDGLISISELADGCAKLTGDSRTVQQARCNMMLGRVLKVVEHITDIVSEF